MILPHFHVVAAVIQNDQGQVLIAKRPAKKHLAGYWEFPGGKVEENEPVFNALRRELDEEIEIFIIREETSCQTEYTYTDKQVLLDVWWIKEFSGNPQGNEGQTIQWVSISNLTNH